MDGTGGFRRTVTTSRAEPVLRPLRRRQANRSDLEGAGLNLGKGQRRQGKEGKKLTCPGLTPLFLDELCQAELFDPVTDLPQSQAQIHGRMGLNPAVAFQGGQDFPLFHLF